MRIELRERGGLAKLDRRILVLDDRLTLTEAGEVRKDRTLESPERDALKELVETLERQAPRPSYGRLLGRVPYQTALSVEHTCHTSLSVRPDPAFEQPPGSFWRIVRKLHALVEP